MPIPTTDSTLTSLSQSLHWARLLNADFVHDLRMQYSKGAQPDALQIARQLPQHLGSEERRWITQHLELWPRIIKKFGPMPEKTFLLCDRYALEQSTPPHISQWKARLWPLHSRWVDLCCGMGGDALHVDSNIQWIGLDLDPGRAVMFRHNTAVAGHPHPILLADAIHYDVQSLGCDFAHIDPARRTSQHGSRWDLKQLTPSWSELQTLQKAFAGMALKLPPGFPQELLDPQWAVFYVGSPRDCLECLVLTGELARAHAPFNAVQIRESHVEIYSGAPSATPLPQAQYPGAWIMEPNPTLLRSHLFVSWAQAEHLEQLDPNIAYLTGSQPVATNWAHSYQVLDWCELGLQRVRKMLRSHDIGPLTLKKRGVAVDPVQEIRQLKAKGTRAGTLIYTRLQNKKIAILTISA